MKKGSKKEVFGNPLSFPNKFSASKESARASHRHWDAVTVLPEDQHKNLSQDCISDTSVTQQQVPPTAASLT